MSATLNSAEPYQLPAGLLALVVHAAFFVLLYFGFTWQIQTAETLSVELWQSIPDEPAPQAVPKVAEAVQPAQPEKMAKPDIALKDKQDNRKFETKPVVTKPEKKQVEPQPVPQNSIEQKLAEQAAAQQAAQVAREKAAQDIAMDAMVIEYKAKIVTRIRRNIVKPPDVPDDARAEFRVTLLPGGAVLSAELKRSSGNEAYDNAVERAILKSQPLPLPSDVAMFNRFRVLLLVFRPAE